MSKQFETIGMTNRIGRMHPNAKTGVTVKAGKIVFDRETKQPVEFVNEPDGWAPCRERFKDLAKHLTIELTARGVESSRIDLAVDSLADAYELFEQIYAD